MRELGLDNFKEIPYWVHDYFKKYSYCGTYFNEYVELTFFTNDFGTLYLQCRNLEIVNTMIFIVPIPNKKSDFLTLMRILNI